MSVSLFRLFPQGINLMNLSTEPIQLVCHIFISHHLMPYLCSGVCAHDTIFNACFWFKIIDTCVLVPACHLEFITPPVGEFLTLLDLHCPDPGAWSLWILHVADQSGTVEAWIFVRPVQSLFFQPPIRLSSFSFYNLWASFVLFILVYPFVFSHFRLSMI